MWELFPNANGLKQLMFFLQMQIIAKLRHVMLDLKKIILKEKKLGNVCEVNPVHLFFFFVNL